MAFKHHYYYLAYCERWDTLLEVKEVSADKVGDPPITSAKTFKNFSRFFGYWLQESPDAEKGITVEKANQSHLYWALMWNALNHRDEFQRDSILAD